MNEASRLAATPWKESGGKCACCGRTSKTIWGDLSQDKTTLAVYYVQWTVESPEHNPNIDLVLGQCGEATVAENRFLVSLLFKPATDGGAFMVIDAEERLQTKRNICGRAMRRCEVVGTPLAGEVFRLVDALWLTDPRMSEMQTLNNGAHMPLDPTRND
jgi:hypothetical protein